MIEKKTFRSEVSTYINFYSDKVYQNKIATALVIQHEKSYCINVLNKLAKMFIKEHPMDDNHNFNKNIDVMTTDIKTTNYKNYLELQKEMLDNLIFLRKKYVYEKLLNSVGAK